MVVATLAFEILKNYEELRQKGGLKDFNELFVELYSVLGEVLIAACAILDNCSLVQYQIADISRSIYKLTTKKESFTVYKNINFCCCPDFQQGILNEATAILCKHVLAVKLNDIVGKCDVKMETITDSQFAEFLNELINFIEES